MHAWMNECEQQHIADLLIYIIGFDKTTASRAVGTGFIVEKGVEPLVLTAAHNLSALVDVQDPYARSTRSAFPGLQGKQEGSAHPDAVRAFNASGGMCEITGGAWDYSSDVGGAHIRRQDGAAFSDYIKTDTITPQVGDSIMVAGLANFTTQDNLSEGNRELKLSMEFVCRVGEVTGVYENGCSLVRGPCVTTTIPIYAGMSGGPAFVMNKQGEGVCVGLISAGDRDANHDDTTVAGYSIVSLLQFDVSEDASGSRSFEWSAVGEQLKGKSYR